MNYIEKYQIPFERFNDLYNIHRKPVDWGLSKQLLLIGQVNVNLLVNIGLTSVVTYSWLGVGGSIILAYGIKDQTNAVTPIALFAFQSHQNVIQDVKKEAKRQMEVILQELDPFLKVDTNEE